MTNNEAIIQLEIMATNAVGELAKQTEGSSEAKYLTKHIEVLDMAIAALKYADSASFPVVVGRECAIKFEVCPMCNDCPDGCPLYSPTDSRNKEYIGKGGNINA